jgi:hypothetical protein
MTLLLILTAFGAGFIVGALFTAVVIAWLETGEMGG